MVAEISEFKGHPVITLKKAGDEGYGFTFGRMKAKLIIENLEEVKAFAEGEE